MRFVLLDRIQQDVLESVRGGEVDFGVVVEPPTVDDLHCEAILHDPFVLVTPARHRLARAASVRWKALDGEALVLLDAASGSRRYVDDALARHGAALQGRTGAGASDHRVPDGRGRHRPDRDAAAWRCRPAACTGWRCGRCCRGWSAR